MFLKINEYTHFRTKYEGSINKVKKRFRLGVKKSNFRKKKCTTRALPDLEYTKLISVRSDVIEKSRGQTRFEVK